MGDSPRSGNGSPALSDASGKRSRQDDPMSRQSGRVTFPNSAKSVTSQHSGDADGPQRNPFKMPPDSDIFMLRDKERQRKKQERMNQRGLKVHEKTTYASKINFKTAAMIHPADSDDDENGQASDKAVAVKDDPQFTIAVTRDRHVEKESLAEYISKKRDMFLVQYSLGVKRDEMRKLEEIAQAEERKLELAEQYLEEDAAMFDEFLKENDKASVEAIKIAEQETKAKLAKVEEIKRINAQMMAIKSEISKYEDTLKEYQLYRRFLDTLTPADIKEVKDREMQMRREERQREKEKNAFNKKKSSVADVVDNRLVPVDYRAKRRSSKSNVSLPAVKSGAIVSKRPNVETDSVISVATDVSDEDSDEDLDLHFSDPQQLLEIFAELEEQNLSLIQNSQETEEALEDMKQNIKLTEQRMNKETKVLKEQIYKLESSIEREEEKAADLKMKSKMFNFGEFKEEDQEKMLGALNKKVEEVYRNCIGDNEANISTLQMLTNIENRLEELFEQIEMMPPDKVEAAEKAKEKERRLKQREEKIIEQKKHQEERVQRALERAKAEPKKKTGKRLVFRSEPPRLKKKEDDADDQASKEEDELSYYFVW